MKSLFLLAAFAASLFAPASVLALDAISPAKGKEIYDKALQSYSCVDYEKALRLFKANAEAGHGLSQYMTGIMLEQGQGAEEDVTAAFNWYMKAAQQGLSDAYYALGDMYSRGVSVNKDALQAYVWFDLASRGGHKLAPDMKLSEAAHLQPAQLETAKTMASDWLAKLGR
ncbi:MAG: tetratricopeptide repeat protein [Gallionellaceae bacterium]|nr:tetratricopeptide repeat protein [Gallionellaceae bacterium]